MTTFRIALAVSVLASIASSQPVQHLLDGRTRDLLHEELSGELAKDHVLEITRHHRIQGSRGYREAAQYVLSQLRAMGFSEQDAYCESFKSDGKVTYQTWQSPSGWDISWGELRMLEPYDERIVGYPEIAMSVITYSNPGDVTAELVWVGDGTTDKDYAGKDVKGKIVLATGYGGFVHRLAVLKYGAKAVVCYLDDDRAMEHPDMLQYTGMWPKTEELAQTTFGFNISKRQGEKLRGLLLSGQKVVVRGQVKGTGLEPFFMDVVVAHIRGSEKPAEELVMSAHLDHPKESANDNASGSAALLDIARSLKTLTGSGRLAPLKRSIRFVWVPEWNGTMPYIDAHSELVGPELGGTFLGNLNLDMVGENEELLHSAMIITRTPNSIPSILNDVAQDIAEMVRDMEIRTARGSLSTMNFRMIPYSGGSDHMMFIDRKIPGLMLGHGPDYTHHTSDDTPDKVDPVELERSELIAAGAFYYLSNLNVSQALEVTTLAAADNARHLGEAGRWALGMLIDATPEGLTDRLAEALTIVSENAAVAKKGIASVLWFNDDPRVRNTAAAFQAEMDSQARLLAEQLRACALHQAGGAKVAPKAARIDYRIPVRLTRGPLDFGLPESKLSENEAASASSRYSLGSDIRFEIPNFIDGKRTITEIGKALTGEFGAANSIGYDRFIEDLVKVGVVRWK